MATETKKREALKTATAQASKAHRGKVAKKKATAKAKGGKATEGLLFDPHKIPAKGKKLASIYKETSELKSKATGDHKTAKTNLLEWMRESGHTKIPVELGGVRKLLVLEEEDKIKIETAAKPPEAGENGADE